MLQQIDSTLTEATGAKAVMLKGFIGTATPLTATWVSFLPEVEAIMRLIVLVLGGIVSIMTIWSLWRNSHKKKK